MTHESFTQLVGLLHDVDQVAATMPRSYQPKKTRKVNQAPPSPPAWTILLDQEDEREDEREDESGGLFEIEI